MMAGDSVARAGNGYGGMGENMITGDDEYLRVCFNASVLEGLARRDPWWCTPLDSGAACRYRDRCKKLQEGNGGGVL